MGMPDYPAVLDDYEEYRDINYVREQCKKIVDQLLDKGHD
jgi:hypothetical protein